MSSTTGYDGNLGHERSKVWQDDAACRGEPYQYFDYQDGSTPLTEGMNYDERFEFNKENLTQGIDICMSCPVFVTCGKEATFEESRWTVRSGIMPIAFTAEETKRAAGEETKVCQKGHVKDGPGRCRQCKTNAMKRARENARRLASAPSGGV